MTIQYETVKYGEGAIGRSTAGTVPGFGTPEYYDLVKSPLSRPGGTQSILGQGGLLDAGIGIFEDLNSKSLAGVIGAVQTAGTVYNTFKGKNLRSIAREEANIGIKEVVRDTLPGVIRSQPNGSAAGQTNRVTSPLFLAPPKGR